jgi:hypothetical protein
MAKQSCSTFVHDLAAVSPWLLLAVGNDLLAKHRGSRRSIGGGEASGEEEKRLLEKERSG